MSNRIDDLEICFREILGTLSIEEIFKNEKLIEQAAIAKVEIEKFKGRLKL